MEARLTEFSYGYCVTEELANGTGPGFKTAPYFPSLYSEGKKGGGFDVQIGSALFLQFKLSEELTRRSARETREGLLQPTFFRFWLHRRDRSSQHQLLIDLESEPGNQVYYIAPEFADINSLDDAYQKNAVTSRSAMFSPVEIGPLPDDKYHSVAFKPDESSGWFLSKSKSVKIERMTNVIRRARGRHLNLKSSAPDSLPNNVQDWLNKVLANMKQILHKRGKAPGSVHRSKKVEHDLGPVEEITYIARTHFGCEFFLFVNPQVEP